MSLPFTFATQAGNVPASELDANFNAVGAMGITACTASGTNAISLTSASNQPPISAYADYQAVGFVASATTSGPVTLQINGLGFLSVFDVTGAQLDSGSLVISQYYVVIYNSALNTGSGGFQLISVNSTTSLSITTAKSGTASATTNAVLADISGMSITLDAGATYSIIFNGKVTCGTTGGFQAGIGGTATYTSFNMEGFVDSAGGYAGNYHPTSPGQVIFANSLTLYPFFMWGTLVVNAGGTITGQFAQSTSNGTASVLASCNLVLIRTA